tara:strand:+ start:122875 stop:123300 length:426 start_codon:yes stop_codon:yes gene_type:complete
MKKIIVLLLISLTSILFTACSSNNDSDPPIESTSLYGTWDLDYYIQNGDLIENVTCSNQITYVFSNARTYTKTTFAGEGSVNCSVAVIVNGTWEYLGNNQFRVTPNGSSADQNLTITFLDNFKKFSIRYSSTDTKVFAKRN